MVSREKLVLPFLYVQLTTYIFYRVEHEIDKKLGITSKDDVMKMGIAKYNEECVLMDVSLCQIGARR